MYDIIIIGAGPAGMTAAIYGRRANKKVLVIGNEGDGISRIVKEASDVVVSIPMKGKINSLNASVASGVIIYEAVRQREL